MKLTNYILELGRAIAYYPGLKKVTTSTTSSILLCQFLYWTPKTKDGWIWKTSSEIEEETGLTYNEQKTARRILVELGLLEEEFKRLDHTSRYRVNQEELNRRWEESSGEKAEEVVVEQPFDDVTAEFMKMPPQAVRNIPLGKKGDLVDGVLDTLSSSGMTKALALNRIKEKMEKRLHINVDNKTWERFVEFVYVREKQGEAVDRFLDWAIKEGGFNPVYWTAEKMKTLWPQAFIKGANEPRENFVEKFEEPQEEEYAPMPKDMGIQRDLY